MSGRRRPRVGGASRAAHSGRGRDDAPGPKAGSANGGQFALVADLEPAAPVVPTPRTSPETPDPERDPERPTDTWRVSGTRLRVRPEITSLAQLADEHEHEQTTTARQQRDQQRAPEYDDQERE